MDTATFKRKLRAKMKENRKAFEGEYREQINELMGLSKADVEAVTPDTSGMEVYDQLITVVKEASSVNLSQAELKQRVEDLGGAAIQIARKVPSLASMF